MLESLRLRLTLWFVTFSLLLYATGGFFSTFVLGSALTRSLDDELRRLLPEIRPSVEIVDGKPSLRTWALNAKHVNAKFLPTIQIFDNSGNLLESYGAPGVNRLHTGTLREGVGDQSLAVRSENRMVLADEITKRAIGYIQVQVSTKHEEEVLSQFVLTTLVLAPFSAIGLGLFGYVFSGKAVHPVEQTLKMLRRFVADAGHELNTPISVIEAGLQTVEQMQVEKEDPSEVIEVITRASARLRDLSSNLMLLARVESLEQVWPKVPLLAKDMVDPLIEEFAELARRKKINLVCDPVPELYLIGHSESLSRMLSNLVNNALSYTESGGTVRVSVNGTDGDVAFVVQDTGIGIPAESLEHIFERFYRVDKSRSRAAGGSGLGLSIVKAIVELHQGSIKVESTVGEGTKFIVHLPQGTA